MRWKIHVVLFYWGNLMERGHLENLCVEGKITIQGV